MPALGGFVHSSRGPSVTADQSTYTTPKLQPSNKPIHHRIHQLRIKLINSFSIRKRWNWIKSSYASPIRCMLVLVLSY